MPDKGAVEGIVGWSRRNFMVPLPRFATWDEFNDETLSAIDGVDGSRSRPRGS